MNSPAYRWHKRADKRAERKNVHPLQIAYYEGLEAGDFGRGKNHYPPGYRHDEWERGFKNSQQDRDERDTYRRWNNG